MIKYFLLVLLMILFVFAPLLGLAAQQFKTQQNYPNIGGSELIKQKASESLPSLVKYLFNLAVWLCILAAVLALIIGGVQYVSSAGQVEKMRSARTKIYSSLLGLAILIGSYLILHTANPQLVIPRIAYQPIKSGIVLFTKTGFDTFKASSDASIINDLASQKEARLLSNNVSDLTAELGDLVVTECASGKVSKNSSGEVIIDLTATKLNFENFPLYTIGFWGKQAKGANVAVFGKKDYSAVNIASEKYTAQGKMDAANLPVLGSVVTYNGMQIISPSHFSSFTNEVSYLGIANVLQANGDINDIKLNSPPLQVSSCISGDVFNLFSDKSFRQKPSIIKSGAVKHPPLSMKIEMNGPGVYLTDAAGNEKYFDSSVADLASPEINFNQMAKTIKIVNDIVYKYIGPDGNLKEEKEAKDYLAILHEGDNFSGYLKIYYEARRHNVGNSAETTEKAKNKFIPAYTKGGTPASLLADGTAPAGFFKDARNPFIYFNQYTFGHLPPNPALASAPLAVGDYQEDVKNKSSHKGAASWEENYGGLMNSVSSLQVFELAEDQTNCQEVRLCTEKQARGYCIAYVAKDSIAKAEPNTVFYPMPVYEAQNIPCPNDSDILKTCPQEKMTVKTPSGDKNVNFAKEGIKSIIIKPEGKCAVALFENYLSPVDVVGTWHFSGWVQSFVPGRHSEVFTYSDYDLTNNEIGLCGFIPMFKRWTADLCADSIVVFPIK